MANVAVTYTFAPATTILSARVNQNYTDLVNYINARNAGSSAWDFLLAPATSLSALTNQLVLGTTNTTTISATAPASSAVYTIPDVGTSANFILSAGTQTIGGAKTMSSALTISPVSNQLVLGTTNTTTITSTAPSGSRVYKLPDAGGDTTFVMSAGNQTLTGNKTFSAAITPSAGIVGTATNDSATAGNVGESVRSAVTGTNAPSSLVYGDLTSISLTAGDWLVSAVGQLNPGTSSVVLGAVVGVSTTSGNSATGLVSGDNSLIAVASAGTTGMNQTPFCIAGYRVSIASTTTVYLKMRATYGSGQPNFDGRLSAVRIR